MPGSDCTLHKMSNGWALVEGDERAGGEYYWHEATRRTTWTFPQDARAAKKQRKAPKASSKAAAPKKTAPKAALTPVVAVRAKELYRQQRAAREGVPLESLSTPPSKSMRLSDAPTGATPDASLPMPSPLAAAIREVEIWDRALHGRGPRLPRAAGARKPKPKPKKAKADWEKEERLSEEDGFPELDAFFASSSGGEAPRAAPKAAAAANAPPQPKVEQVQVLVQRRKVSATEMAQAAIAGAESARKALTESSATNSAFAQARGRGASKRSRSRPGQFWEATTLVSHS